MVDSAQSPKRVKVRIKASKTDQFQEGSDVYLHRTYRDAAMPSSSGTGLQC